MECMIQNMKFSLFFLVLTVLWKISSCVLCFKCYPEDVDYDISKPLCKNFDGSDKYIENCTKSTMCSKRVTTLSVGNGMTSVSVHRDCAIQSLGQEQIQLNGKWHREVVIHEVYQEGCDEDLNDMERLTKTLNCHCRGNYCNGSIANVINFNIIVLTFLIYIFQFS